MLHALSPWSPERWRQLVKMPFSGAVTQDIAPTWFPTTINVTGRGEPELESRIVSEVATYGKQIGELTDVVLALAGQAGLENNDALTSLRDIAADVERKKREYRDALPVRARHALNELAQTDPEALSQILDEYRKTVS